MEKKLDKEGIVQRKGKNFIIQNVPFIGDMIFVPAIIQWSGVVENPFFKDKNFKTVKYYLTKKGENKNTLVLNLLFKKYPNILNKEVLEMPLGMFADFLNKNYSDISLKIGKKEFPVKKLLVNPSGGEDFYVSFRVENITKEKGLYLWVIDGNPEYIGIASSDLGLGGRINQEYGNITPYKCSRDGQSQTCRSNISIRDKYQEGKIVSLYICPVDIDILKNNEEFMESLSQMGFKGTMEDKNILEVLEKFIISKGGFKDSGWNRRM